MADAPGAKVGVVTVTYNSAAVLPDFLSSLGAQEAVEIVLYAVDNASGDASVKLLHETSPVHTQVIPNAENLGVAVGNNQGIMRALSDGCDWILLLNNDTVLPPQAVGGLVRAAEREGIDILTPVIEATEPASTVWYSSGHFVPWQGYRTFHDGTGKEMSSISAGEFYETQYAPTCCLLIRPDVFQRVGLMDPVYFVYFDDVDFAIRCRKAGIAYWVTSEVTIVHKASSLTGGKSSTFTVTWVARNWPLIARRHLSAPRALMALGFIQAWMLGRLVLMKDSPRAYGLRQRAFRAGVQAARAPAPPAAPTLQRRAE